MGKNPRTTKRKQTPHKRLDGSSRSVQKSWFHASNGPLFTIITNLKKSYFSLSFLSTKSRKKKKKNSENSKLKHLKKHNFNSKNKLMR